MSHHRIIVAEPVALSPRALGATGRHRLPEPPGGPVADSGFTIGGRRRNRGPGRDSGGRHGADDAGGQPLTAGGDPYVRVFGAEVTRAGAGR
ncbi:hypothetical protein Axi01nite_68520 [Actinoplanes xinjiangensis]|nr:hypothetical protein Axi01nite_68520 [Actinoplanes xinjiangensis]